MQRGKAKSVKMSKFLFLIFASVLTLWACISATDYCNPTLCPSRRFHIGCDNRGGYGKKCGANATVVPITGELRQFMLSKLNDYRNVVASGGFGNFNAAERMATIQWDPELATLAELSVKQCRNSQNKCHSTETFKHVGQTIGRIVFRTDKYNMKRLLAHKFNNWFEEYKAATNAHLISLNSDNSEPITSFTQLIQEKSTHVGCGILRETKGNWTQQNIICLFARENFFNQPVYRNSDVAASGCQTGYNPMYKYLCSVNEVYDVNVVDDFAAAQFTPEIRIRIKSAP